MTWAQLRTCKACETPKPLAAFELVRNKGQRPCRRWTCIECLLPDRAAWLREWRARERKAS